MADVQRTPGELQELLQEQLGFLQRSADAFDGGFEGEAKRLATTVRVLCHDTGASRSLLGLLGTKDTLRYVDTALPYDPNNMLAHSGLVHVALRPGKSEPRPFLDGGPFDRSVLFAQWWDGIAFVDDRRTEHSRKDLVLALANKDGGAHVDPALNEEYARLTRENALGFFDVSPPGGPVPAANQVPAAMRQIAHELLKTLIPGYSKKPVTKPDDQLFTFGASQVLGSVLPPIPASNPMKVRPQTPPGPPKVGRNDPCPCGSGGKFKKCCGK